MKISAFNPPWSKIPQDEQSWRDKIKPNQRLIIEIGAGVGLHPIAYAKKNPNDFVISIERTREKATKMLNRVSHHSKLVNIYPVHADAIPWIWQNIAPLEVNKYFILYPNPYPKKSQANKRFFNMPFMHYLLSTLLPMGEITLATNSHDYFNEAYHRCLTAWPVTILKTQLVKNTRGYRTHFEKKYLERGHDCHDLTVMKCF
jgi:tRNA (guanine-N7-)-methyltransferase